jgi:prolactin regulatory element-binding protein
MAVLGGGGGEGRSGVPNKLVVAALDPDAAAPALSTEAVSGPASEIPRLSNA